MTFKDLGTGAEDRAALEYFYQSIYLGEFPDPDERESLENIRDYLQLKEDGGYGRNNYHVVLGYEGGVVVAVCIANYFADSNSGLVEFIVVDSEFRGRVSSPDVLRTMEQAFHADAVVAGYPRADYLLGETKDSFKTDRNKDSMDSFLRTRLFGRYGFCKLDFDYVQPAFGEGQQPVTNLLLMAKLLGGKLAEMPSVVICSALSDYSRLAMRFPDPERVPEFQKMAVSLDSRQSVELQSLADYAAGKLMFSRRKPVAVVEVAPRKGREPEIVVI